MICFKNDENVGNYSDEDYEEMNEELLDEEGFDEVERIKHAMVREKAKADKFIEK